MTDERDKDEIESGTDAKTLAMGSALATAILTLGILILGAIIGGCKSTPSGVKVNVSSASYTNVGDINWDEYKIPVLSLYFGPKTTLWINKEFKFLRKIEVTASVTNTTTTLGIYTSAEDKNLGMRLTFDANGAITNAPPETR